MGLSHHHPRTGAEAGLRLAERRRLTAVLAMTGVMMAAEVAGGFLSGSMSLLGDAVHMLTDFGAILLSTAAVVMAVRPAPPEKTFRNWRIEVLAALLNGLLLLPVAGLLVWESVERFREPARIDLRIMIPVAAAGLLVNLAGATLLHRHSKHNLNLRGAFLHLVVDLWASVGVLAAGTLIAVGGDRLLWADPAAAIAISLLIAGWSVRIVRQSTRILLEAVPAHLDLEKVRGALLENDEVCDIHDLHIWTITSRMYALTAHVHLKRDLPVSETEELGRRLERLLDERFEINHATLQFEVRPASRLDCEHEREAGSAHPH